MPKIRKLGPADLDLILTLQEQIVSGLDDKRIFQRSSPEFISYCLHQGGRCYAIKNGEAVAYRMIYFPRDRQFNLCVDVALPLAERPFVAHWDTIAVLPDWRGLGCSRKFNARALEDLADTDMRHLFATSSPHNPYGTRALMEAGFRPIKLVVKFGGNLRFLFYRPYPGEWRA